MPGWPHRAKRWSSEEIFRDVLLAREEFRRRRLGEPLDRYLAAFAELEKANQRLIEQLARLFSDPVDSVFISEILRDEHLKTALRYLGAPPISEDDLETLLGATLAWTRIRDDAAAASGVRDIIAQILDPKRFPWVAKGKLPRRGERAAAVLASTVVAASQRVQTSRRTDERQILVGAVRGVLVGMGMREVSVRRIENLLRDAPKPGEFTAPCVLGEDEADVVLGLCDHRIMAIECKASNSEINSRKRINKEVGQDARNWVRRFGTEAFVPAAAIQGVFKPAYVEAAQDIPIVFFWGHRLSDLRDFIQTTPA
jgi:hypothetical protein